MGTLFVKTANGTHIDDPKVGYVKTRAFRIEPRESDAGAFVVDGEVSKHRLVFNLLNNFMTFFDLKKKKNLKQDTRTYKTIQATVMHNAGRVFWNGHVEP